MERARPSERSPTRCPYCHDAVRGDEADTIRCRTCAAPHHGACWREQMGCASCRAPDGDGGGSFTILSRRRDPAVRPAPAPPTPEALAAAVAHLRAVDEGDALLLVRPRERSCGAVAFLCVWLCGWAAGEVFAVSALLGPSTPGEGRAFLLLWVTVWTVGGIGALAALVHSLGGEDRLEVRRDEVVLRQLGPLGFPLGAPRRARRADVFDVRAEGPGVVIDHGAGRLGWAQLSPAEAGWIAARARERLGLSKQG